MAAGISESKLGGTGSPKEEYVLERISSERKEYRDRQIADGIVMMLVGGTMLAIALVLVYVIQTMG